MGGAFHLAQLNIARMNYDWEDPEMQDFTEALDPVNAVADSSPGFVWRMVDDEPGQNLIWDDPDWLVNLSVWEDLESLRTFIRSDLHLAVMRNRRKWFAEVAEAYVVLWWVPAGHKPSVAEAQARLEKLRSEGAGPEAFSFARPFPAPAADIATG